MAEWNSVKIGQFLKEREGRYDPDDQTVQCLKRLNKIDFSGEIHLSDKGSKTDMIVVEPGDLVISGINVSKGALAVYHGEDPITATIHYSSYVFDKDQIEIEYFKRFVRSQAFIQALQDQVKGGIKTEIKPKHFLPLEIHLPNLEIQKDIVSFFKSVEGEIDELGSEISSQIEYLSKLRQAVLQEGIEGKLTAEWRKANPALISGENHASKLLEKIKAEKERLIKEGKIKKDSSRAQSRGKPLPPIADDEKPFDLPEGWVWCRLGQLSELITSGSRDWARYYNSNGRAKFVRMGNLSHDNYLLKEDKIQIVQPPSNGEGTRTRLIEMDLLVSITGDVGWMGLIPKDFGEAYINQHTALVRLLTPVRGTLVPKFLLSPLCRKQFDFPQRGIKNSFRLTDLENMIVPLPPLAEQQILEERVDKVMAMIDELEKQVSVRKEKAEMLMQSVLQEAFAGEK